MSFLRAEWRKLAIANYIIDPKLLAGRVPAGTVLDLWNGNCYVSVVGFKFVNTRMLGMKIPFHVNFEEVNLRFYVKRIEDGEEKRGVVFIKEIVPKWAITFVANTVYGEHYQTMKMDHRWEEFEKHRLVRYDWFYKGKQNFIEVEADLASTPMEIGGETEFITEHYWGYAAKNQRKTNEYEVTHPKWEKYDVRNYKIDVDFGAVYGEEFADLSNREPDSVMLAEGSNITVEGKETLRFD